MEPQLIPLLRLGELVTKLQDESKIGGHVLDQLEKETLNGDV
jgi:hypothetical protein